MNIEAWLLLSKALNPAVGHLVEPPVGPRMVTAASTAVMRLHPV